MRFTLSLLILILLAGCGDTTNATNAVAPTRTPAPAKTAAPTAINYVALRTSLLTPLGALIIASRENNTQQIAQHLNNFNVEANKIAPVIEGDMSANANRLHSAIVNVREASARRDVPALEAQRLLLLDVK